MADIKPVIEMAPQRPEVGPGGVAVLVRGQVTPHLASAQRGYEILFLGRIRNQQQTA